MDDRRASCAWGWGVTHGRATHSVITRRQGSGSPKLHNTDELKQPCCKWKPLRVSQCKFARQTTVGQPERCHDLQSFFHAFLHPQQRGCENRNQRSKTRARATLDANSRQRFFTEALEGASSIQIPGNFFFSVGFFS